MGTKIPCVLCGKVKLEKRCYHTKKGALCAKCAKREVPCYRICISYSTGRTSVYTALTLKDALIKVETVLDDKLLYFTSVTLEQTHRSVIALMECEDEIWKIT